MDRVSADRMGWGRAAPPRLTSFPGPDSLIPEDPGWNTLVSPDLFVYWGSQRPVSLVQCSVEELGMDSVKWKLMFSVKK